jgi:tetratricopeptide (TPR) repeat protein
MCWASPIYARRYQNASDAVDRAVTPDPPYARALTWLRAEVLIALNRSEEAAELLDKILSSSRVLTTNESVCYRLSLANALACTGDHERSAEVASAVLPMTSRRGWSLDRASAYRLIAEADEAQGRFKEALAQAVQAQAALQSNWWSQYLWNQGTGQSRFIRFLGGPLGRLFTEHQRTELTYRRIRAKVPADDSDSTLAEMDESADFLALQGQWGILADLLMTQARNALHLLDEGRRTGTLESDGAEAESQDERLAKPLSYALRALRELDRNRSTLRSPRDRASWSMRLHEALGLALPLALQSGDARLQAELIEFGRIQTLPYLDSAHKCDGQVALAVPPVIRVRGQAQVSRYWNANRPSPVDLETAAEATAGFSAWWLSFWQVGSLLYWSLVPPDGPVEGGRIDFSPASELRIALRALQEGLPVLLDGEKASAMDWRMASSPLQANPAAERRDSARLASLLLPRTLLTVMWTRLKTSSEPLPLAIVPSAALASVPWSLLVLSDPDERPTVRLVDAANWVLAPAAGLATSLPQGQQPSGPFPLGLAVVDTWQGPGLAALPAARRQAEALPQCVKILGGRHWTTCTATLTTVRAAIADLDPASTVLFACHALPATSDLTFQGGLVLAEPVASGQPRVLTPSDVIAMAGEGTAMPIQALLLACDSSDLASSAAGEWLTIAPAMLAAGSRTIVTTLFPVRDSVAENDPVLIAAIKGQDLQAAVRELQRSGARTWDTRGPSGFRETPLQWASYAIVAAHQINPAPTEHWVPGLSPRLQNALEHAAGDARAFGGRTVHSGHLLASYLSGPGAMAYGFFTIYSIVVDAGLGLANRMLRAKRDGKPTARLVPSKDLVNAIADAQGAVARERRDIEPEDVLRAAFSGRSPASTLIRAMTLARIQRVEQIHNLLEFTLARDSLNQKERARTKEYPELAAFVHNLEARCSPHIVDSQLWARSTDRGDFDGATG